MKQEDWDSGFKCVAVFLNGEAIPTHNARGERVVDDSFLLCFNANDKPQDFVTPKGYYGKEWTATLDTADATGSTELVVTAGKKVSLQGRSLLVLRKTA
jgi:glycogen operon protein